MTLSVESNRNSVVSNFTVTAWAASSNALENVYSNGVYTLTYVGSIDGEASVGLSLAASSYPTAPIISNLPAAQAINASSNFTLKFLGRPKAGSNDFTQLILVDSASNVVFSTPAPFAPDSRAPNNWSLSAK
jgi:hypothetical protein